MDIEKLLELELPKSDLRALRCLLSGPVFLEAHNADVLNRLIRFKLAEEHNGFFDGHYRRGVRISEPGEDYLVLLKAKQRGQRNARKRSFWRDIVFLFLGAGVTWLFGHAGAILAFVRGLAGA